MSCAECEKHHADVIRLANALHDLVLCHQEGGFVQPDSDVLDNARAALTRLWGPEHDLDCPAIQAWDIPGACHCSRGRR